MVKLHHVVIGNHFFVAKLVLVALLLCYSTMVTAALVPPALDDRSYDALVQELAQRIPVHNPEWTDHNDADPGIALLQLFGGLGKTGLNALIDEFEDIPPWTHLDRNDETYWSELGYVSMEAGLALIASTHQIGSPWPEILWPQISRQVLDQEFENFRSFATVPLPASLPLLALASSLLGAVGRRRKSV